MGVSIQGYHKTSKSYDFGYGRMFTLRKTVAEAILQDKADIYFEWLKTNDDTPQDKLHELCSALYKGVGDGAYNFLTQADCDGKLSNKQVKDLYERIKDSDKDFSMCYQAYYTEESKKDFINLLADCVKNKRGLFWC